VPDILCAVCREPQFIGANTLKFIDDVGDYVCGKACILEWVQRNRVEASRRSWEDEAVELPEERPIQFRSKYEARIAAWLSSEDITWEFECWGFRVGKAAYLPDFYLPDHGVFLEAKGKWGAGQKKKMRQFRKRYQTVPLLVIPWTLSEKFYQQELLKRRSSRR
jgi:hypothetical protein